MSFYIETEAQGELAGQMAARVLRGKQPSDIPVAGLGANQLIFDARQLRRWGIREDTLPNGSIVRYQDPTLWERYGWLIVATGTIVLLQSGLIAALLVNRLRRRRAEQALKANQDVTRRQRDELARVKRVATVANSPRRSRMK